MKWKIIDKLLYLKTAWNQGWGNLSMLTNVMTFVLSGGTFVKVFNIQNYELLAFFGFMAVVGIILLGHAGLKYGITERELSIQNKYNKELKTLLQNTNNDNSKN